MSTCVTCVWSRAGTTAVRPVCLLMLLSCVLFDAHKVGEVIIPIKTAKKTPKKHHNKKTPNIISILDRLHSQRSLLSQRGH